MRLHDPWLLGLLVLVPLVVRWSWREGLATVRFPPTEALRAVGVGRKARLQWVPAVMRTVAVVLVVLALTRPQLGKAPTTTTTEGIDMMLVVDISSSMLAEDFRLDSGRANRLDAVRVAVREFLSERAGDRVGLVLFAGRPYMQSPLTLDHGWLMQNLYRAEVGLIEDGTAIGSALATAVGHLEVADSDSKIIILLTDGQNTAGKVAPREAAEAARALGYKVYTIGAGTKGLAPYPDTDIFGNRRYVPVQVDIDEDTLREIAALTGGRYFRATDTERLNEIYAEIDELETTEFEGLDYLEFEELYLWLAVPALLLLLAEAVLGETWLRVLP